MTCLGIMLPCNKGQKEPLPFSPESINLFSLNQLSHAIGTLKWRNKVPYTWMYSVIGSG
jgi:hypothetical protein